MVWQIEWHKSAAKEFRKLDKANQKQIRDVLVKKIAQAKHPEKFAKPLKRNLSGLWRFRIGDYRVVCEIENEHLVILVLRVGHRKSVYEE